MKGIAGFLLISGLAFAADPQPVNEAGKKALTAACLPCHSLRIVQSQRLSAAAWAKEVDKMVGWGAVVPERQMLVDYLAAEYGNTKPVPPLEHSQSGVIAH